MPDTDYIAAEQLARRDIDEQLLAAGWVVQDQAHLNLAAGTGVAVREAVLEAGHGRADYLLFVNREAVGAIEAKPVGHTLTGVVFQTDKYREGLPEMYPAPIRPLPFGYESTGVETRFANGLDPDPKNRRVYTFHRPETRPASTSCGYATSPSRTQPICRCRVSSQPRSSKTWRQPWPSSPPSPTRSRRGTSSEKWTAAPRCDGSTRDPGGPARSRSADGGSEPAERLDPRSPRGRLCHCCHRESRWRLSPDHLQHSALTRNGCLASDMGVSMSRKSLDLRVMFARSVESIRARFKEVCEAVEHRGPKGVAKRDQRAS